jgi:hypothetical protein
LIPGRSEKAVKRLKGRGIARIRDEDGGFECDEIVLEFDHGRTLTIRRESIHGEDGIALFAGIDRAERTANARFVIRAPNFGQLHLSIEQAK